MKSETRREEQPRRVDLNRARKPKARNLARRRK